MTLNPDFRGADEVIVPDNAEFGWNPDGLPEHEAILLEERAFGELEEDIPVLMRARQDPAWMPEMKAKWDEFQKSKGRHEGSADWSLLDEFVFGKPIVWLPQIIGSCVASNTFRPWVTRFMIQIVLRGQAQEYLGRNEFGPENLSFYAPWSYGMMRRRGGLRRGDGGFCAPMAETLLKDGVMPCNTPALRDLLKRLNVAGSRDFPEPQTNRGAAVYREFGAWKYLDDLKPYADYPCRETIKIRSAEQLSEALQSGKPAFVCSMEAITKIGTHPDGFAIHARDPRNSWAHNMSVNGEFLASNGDRFFRWCNQSWGDQHTYNRRFDEVAQRLRTGALEMVAIGEIDGPQSAPPLIA